MGVAIVTGSGGLIGSESVRYFAAQGLDVIGVENDMRARFFGPEASTAPTSERLVDEVDGFRSLRSSTSATPTASIALFAGTGGRSSWSCTPRRSPRTTGRRLIPRPTSRSMPTAR